VPRHDDLRHVRLAAVEVVGRLTPPNALAILKPLIGSANEDIARAAGVTRGLVHHYFGGRTEVYIALLERLDAMREGSLRQPEGRSARARVADTVTLAGLDRGEPHHLSGHHRAG